MKVGNRDLASLARCGIQYNAKSTGGRESEHTENERGERGERGEERRVKRQLSRRRMANEERREEGRE
jgi:hypothetical protein